MERTPSSAPIRHAGLADSEELRLKLLHLARAPKGLPKGLPMHIAEVGALQAIAAPGSLHLHQVLNQVIMLHDTQHFQTLALSEAF